MIDHLSDFKCSLQDLDWARQALEEFAAGLHPKIYSLERLRDTKHLAFAQVVVEALASSSTSLRATALWVLGEIRFVDERAIPALGESMQDADEEIRLAALWAAGKLPDYSAMLVPILIAAAGDKNNGIQFAAISALDQLGSLAVAAIPILQVCAESSDDKVRGMAIRALGNLAADDWQTQQLLAKALDDSDPGVRFSAIMGLAASPQQPREMVDAFRHRLVDIDPGIQFLAAWALGSLHVQDAGAVEDVLQLLAQPSWLEIADCGRVVCIDMRNDVQKTFHQLLPQVEDELLDDFRRLFLPGAVHPDAPLPDWLARTAEHQFFRKIQAARFRPPKDRAEKQRLAQRMDAAIQEFRVWLHRKPTLGITPARYRELPGYIKLYTKRIAARIRKEEPRNSVPLLGFDLSDNQPSPEQLAARNEWVALLQEVTDNELTLDEARIIRYHYLQSHTIEEIADLLNLTRSQVKTRIAQAFTKLRRRLLPIFQRPIS